MPVVNNYPLLPMDPSPSPTDLPSLLTWGTLLATPRALDGSGDPLDMSGPTFRMPDSKRRDELGRRLGDRAGKSMHERAKGFTPSTLRAAADRTQRAARSDKTPGQMLPPASTPRRSDNLTPAAKRLLERSLGRSPAPIGRSEIIGTSGRNRGAAMERGSGWGLGGKGGLGGRNVGGMSWTPSPHRKH
jgi:protein DGCR14